MASRQDGFEAPDRIWLTEQQDTVRRTIRESTLVRSLTDGDKLNAAFPRLPMRERWRLFSVAIWSREFGVNNGHEPLADLAARMQRGEVPLCDAHSLNC